MTTIEEQNIHLLLERMMAKDVAGMLALLTDDAEIFDPHYPYPLMQGKVAIERGLNWAMNIIVKPGFTIKQIWSENGRCVAEVDTNHTFKGGQSVAFPQVFRIDFADDKITKIHAFVPNGPPGIGGWITWITGWIWKLKGY